MVRTLRSLPGSGYAARIVPRVLPVDPTNPDPAIIAEAAKVLKRGGLVAFPTETVYGLGARGLHAAEVSRIFEAKKRPPGHPLILHVDGEAMAVSLASSWSPVARALVAKGWPGPLTLVVPKAAHVPLEVTGGLPAVGVRCPRHPVAQALIREVGEPLAAPSANAHMHISPTTAEHVVRSLGDRVDLVLDAGPCAHGIESTVVDVGSDPPRVLRPGALDLAALRAIVPDVLYESVTVEGDVARASPGLASKHYAPHARVALVDGTQLLRLAREDAASGMRVHVLVFGAETFAIVTSALATPLASPVTVRRLPDDPEGYAHELFAAFYDADASSCDRILVERVPDTTPWWAVADRLRRAAEKG